MFTRGEELAASRAPLGIRHKLASNKSFRPGLCFPSCERGWRWEEDHSCFSRRSWEYSGGIWKFSKMKNMGWVGKAVVLLYPWCWLVHSKGRKEMSFSSLLMTSSLFMELSGGRMEDWTGCMPCRTRKMIVVLSQGERAEGSPELGEQMAESLLLHCFWLCVSSPRTQPSLFRLFRS